MTRAMNITTLIARILLGAACVFFGLNGFFHFMDPPAPPPSQQAAALGGALMASGYVFPMVFGVFVVAGVALLAGRFVPLALAILTPVLVNVVAFHGFLQPDGIGVGVVLSVLTAFLAWAHRDAYLPMLAFKPAPAVTAANTVEVVQVLEVIEPVQSEQQPARRAG